MPPPTSAKFPLIEGIGIFVGVLAWDLLSEGHLEVGRALLITVPFTLGWFAIRCWRHKSEKWYKSEE